MVGKLPVQTNAGAILPCSWSHLEAKHDTPEEHVPQHLRVAIARWNLGHKGAPGEGRTA
jgi:hypothetical protein